MLLYSLAFTSLYMIVSDIRYRLIPVWALLVFAGITICHTAINPLTLESFLPSLILLTIIMAISWGIERIKGLEAIGSGDVILLTLSGFWISVDQIPFFLILMGGLGLLSGVLWKVFFHQHYFPFAPSILLALFLIF